MYRQICQKLVHFLSAQMALVSTFFQMFIVLGMYNFAYDHNWYQNSYEDFKIPPSHFYFGVLFWYYEKIGIFLIN